MQTNNFKECETQKERVKACYGDWFNRLWGGSADRHRCEQETQDYRDCVEDVLYRRKQEARWRRNHNDDNDSWMDRAAEATGNLFGTAERKKENAKDRANAAYDDARRSKDDYEYSARRTKDDVKENIADNTRDLQKQANRTKESWKESARETADQARRRKDEVKENIADNTRDIKDSIKDNTREAKDKANRKIDHWEDSAREMGEQARRKADTPTEDRDWDSADGAMRNANAWRDAGTNIAS